MNQLTLRDLDLHVPVVGWVLLIGHALFLLIGVFVFVLLTGIGAASRDPQAVAVLGVVGISVAILLCGLALPGVVAGYGLLRRRPWARVLALVVSILGLFNVPVGTLIGAYAIWVLVQQAAGDYFAPQTAVLGSSAGGSSQAAHA